MHIRTTLLVLLLISLPLTALAQDGRLSPDERSKLGGQFQVLLQSTDGADRAAKRGGTSGLTPVLKKIATTDERGVTRFPSIIRTEDPAALEAAGISVNSELPNFVTARLTTEDLRTVASLDVVHRVSASGYATSHNDEAAREVGARILNSGAVNNTNYTGQGVLTCVIDSGLDYDHGDFMDANGNTRVEYIWDQVNTTTGQTPEDRNSTDFDGLDYGTEYSATDIDNDNVSETDQDGHGTHVAGTVASSGNALVRSGSQSTPEHQGMAPESDIVIVKAGNGSFSSANVADALTYCRQVAANQGKPVVANLSLGSSSGPHDGTSFLAQSVDFFTDGTPENSTLDPGTAENRIAVVSAGNDGSSAQHVSNTVGSSSSGSETITIGEEQQDGTLDYSAASGDVNDLFLTQLWLDGANDATITLTAPNGTDKVTLTATGNTPIAATDSTQSGAFFIGSEVSSANGDRLINIQIYDWEDTSVSPSEMRTPATGTWTIKVQNDGSSATTYHGWTWQQTIPGSYDNGNDDYTIGSPGTATGAITVGSHAHRWYWGTDGGALGYSGNFNNRNAISYFSSRGPRRDGHLKPELTAPGQGMISSYSQDMPGPSANDPRSSRILDQAEMHRLTQGTSMAAPVVAGSVALLLQAAEQRGEALTANEVETLLTNNTETDSYTGSVPNSVFGYGKLDILSSVVEYLGGVDQREKVADFENVGTSSLGNQAIGGANPERVAVRFTPSVDGFVTGATLNLWYNGSSSDGSVQGLTGPLNVEIWSDDGSGDPGSKQGSTVQVPAEQLNLFTPNSFNLEDTGVSVTPGTDYHLVLYPSNASDVLTMAGDVNSPTGRTQTYDGSSWSEPGLDLSVRTEVTRIGGLGTRLPVEFASFDGQADDGAVQLQWTTASETDNTGFHVERRVATEASAKDGNGVEAAWKTVGYVEGSGTTTEARDYQFVDEDLPFESETLTYRLRQEDVDGSVTYSDEKTVALGGPDALTLHAPFPNPAADAATLRYELPSEMDVSIQIYDVLGRQVWTADQGSQTSGHRELTLPTKRLSAGAYFVRMEAGDKVQTQRLMIAH